jgi:hypothetical protein
MNVLAHDSASPRNRAATGWYWLLAATVFLAWGATAKLYAYDSKNKKTGAAKPAAAREKLTQGQLAGLEPVFAGKLTEVPELGLFPVEQQLTVDESKQRIKETITDINRLNVSKKDGFLLGLLEKRGDLQGLPFLLGDDCRKPDDTSLLFRTIVLGLRGGPSTSSEQLFQTSPAKAAEFWKKLAGSGVGKLLIKGNVQRGQYYSILTDVLMQVVGPDTVAMRQGLVQYLAAMPDPSATRALARLAIFSPEREIHGAAVAALKVRNEKDYTDVLFQGLSYPWPEVAERSAAAIAAIGRMDLVPTLVNLLDQPDPRLPQPKQVDGKEVHVARQLVRLNHHRNCLLCHATVSGKLSSQMVTAPIPVSGEKFPPPFLYYSSHSSSGLLVRADVTYLRQDFSRLQKVNDADPWPAMQRYDFLVRSVQMSQEQAKGYATQFNEMTAGQPSPYQRPLVLALRALTGVDAGPSAAAWRKALKLPA